MVEARKVDDASSSSVIRPPASKAVVSKGPPPPTVGELLAKADPLWVSGFALAVQAVAFAAMACEGELPLSYVLTAVSVASLAAFVKLKL